MNARTRGPGKRRMWAGVPVGEDTRVGYGVWRRVVDHGNLCRALVVACNIAGDFTELKAQKQSTQLLRDVGSGWDS